MHALLTSQCVNSRILRDDRIFITVKRNVQEIRSIRREGQGVHLIPNPEAHIATAWTCVNRE